jgi:hypothetical protein
LSLSAFKEHRDAEVYTELAEVRKGNRNQGNHESRLKKPPSPRRGTEIEIEIETETEIEAETKTEKFYLG